MIIFPNLTVAELEMLNEADTYDKWKSAVNKVLLAREGHYPPDWNERVVQVPADTEPPPPFVYNYAEDQHAVGF